MMLSFTTHLPGNGAGDRAFPPDSLTGMPGLRPPLAGRFLPILLKAGQFGAETRAVEDGDDFIVNGQKIWTSMAHFADMCILLTRTDPHAPKHKGISFLLVDMHSPGVTVKPLRQLTGGAEFNEVFFENVRVPRQQLVGQLNDGWRIAMTTLTHERGSASFGTQVQLKRALDTIIDAARRVQRHGQPLSADPVIRQKLAQAYIQVDVMRLNNYRSMTTQLRGQPPGPEASLDKLYWS